MRGYEFNDADPETVLVIRSVLPVFTRESDRPERVGTCVLARIDGHPFIYPEGLSRDHHLLLHYPTDEMLLSGRSINPPKVQGMSGGGVFRFQRRRPETIKLVGILIEYHKTPPVMVATRVAVVADLAREVIARHPEAFR